MRALTPTFEHKDEPASPGARPRRWTVRRIVGALGLFALAASLWIHAVSALLAVLFAWYSPGTGVATGIGQGERGIELGPATSLKELAGGELSAPSGVLEKPVQPAGAESIAPDVLGDLPDPTAGVTGDSGVAGGAGDSSLFSPGAGGGSGGSGFEGGGGGGSARFFGVEARGKRFLYLCDRSGSMQDERLEALKTELMESVNALSPGSQFAVVFFSTDAENITGNTWIEAGPKAREQLRRLLRGVTAYGGTEPLPGFTLAFSMRPRPDAVYFMTDGQFGEGQEEQVVARISSMNNSATRPCPIHCISFIETAGEKIMKMIARSSGGVYRHVPGLSSRTPGGAP